MLEKQNYKNVDTIIPFLAAFLDRCTGLVEEPPLTKLHVLYFELVKSMTKDEVSEGWNKNKLMKLQCKIKEFRNCWSGHLLHTPILVLLLLG